MFLITSSIRQCWMLNRPAQVQTALVSRLSARVRASSSCNYKQSRSWLCTRTIFTERDAARWNSTEWTVYWKRWGEGHRSLFQVGIWGIFTKAPKLAAFRDPWCLGTAQMHLKTCLEVSKDPGSVFPPVLNCEFEKAQLGNGRLKCCSMGAGYLRSRC